jgi:hypothetical protein
MPLLRAVFQLDGGGGFIMQRFLQGQSEVVGRGNESASPILPFYSIILKLAKERDGRLGYHNIGVPR